MIHLWRGRGCCLGGAVVIWGGLVPRLLGTTGGAGHEALVALCSPVVVGSAAIDTLPLLGPAILGTQIAPHGTPVNDEGA